MARSEYKSWDARSSYALVRALVFSDDSATLLKAPLTWLQAGCGSSRQYYVHVRMGTVVSVSRLYVLDVKIRVVWAADAAMIGRSVDVGGRAATNRLQRGSEERKQKDVRETRKCQAKGSKAGGSWASASTSSAERLPSTTRLPYRAESKQVATLNTHVSNNAPSA